MAATVRAILGDPGSVAGHPNGDAARNEVIAAGHIPGVELPGVIDISIRSGRSHPAEPFPGGTATITLDVGQLPGTDEVRDITGRLIDATLTDQTGRLLTKSWRPADQLAEFVTVAADVSWVGTDGSTMRRAWWPIFSGSLRRTTRRSGREGRDLLTLHAADSSAWLGASTGMPISGAFAAWPAESVTDRINRILTAAVYPTNRLTGGVVDPATTPQPDGALPRLRRVQIQPETVRQVAAVTAAPSGSLLSEARETVRAWAGDLFWHHGIGDIADRDVVPSTVTMPSGAVVQTDWGDLIVLTGSGLDATVPSVTRQGFASPVVFGHSDPNPRPDGEGGVWAAYADITDDIDATKTASVALWNRSGGDEILRTSAWTGEWIRRVGWRTSERSDTLHVSDADLRLAAEYHILEFARPRRIWRWETTSALADATTIATDRQLAQAMTALRHRVSLGVLQSSDTMTTAECHIEQVSHRIAGGIWTTGYTAVPASTAVDLRGWGRTVVRRDTVGYVAAPMTPSSNTFAPPDDRFVRITGSSQNILWTLTRLGTGFSASSPIMYAYDTTQTPPTEIAANRVIMPGNYVDLTQGSMVVRGGRTYVWTPLDDTHLIGYDWTTATPETPSAAFTETEFLQLPIIADGTNVEIEWVQPAAKPGESVIFLLIMRQARNALQAYYDIFVDRVQAPALTRLGTPAMLWSHTDIATASTSFHLAGAAATADHLYALIQDGRNNVTPGWYVWRWAFTGNNVAGLETSPLPSGIIPAAISRSGGIAAIGSHLWVPADDTYHRITIADQTWTTA